MSFNPNKPVSLDEYNTALRDSVNAYYVHAMNDPTMSKEEAIKSTAEMSEKYIGAVQEFQESQGMQTIAGDTAVDSGVRGGGIGDDESGGIDNDGDSVDDGMDI